MIGLLKYDLISMRKIGNIKDYYRKNMAGLILFIIIFIKVLSEDSNLKRVWSAFILAIFYSFILIETETRIQAYNSYLKIFPLSEKEIAVESIIFNMMFFIPVLIIVKIFLSNLILYVLIFFEMYALYLTPYAYEDKDTMTVASVIIVLVLLLFALILIFVTKTFPEYFTNNDYTEIFLMTILIISCIFNYFSIKNRVKKMS